MHPPPTRVGVVPLFLGCEVVCVAAATASPKGSPKIPARISYLQTLCSSFNEINHIRFGPSRISIFGEIFPSA
jgi:hypothetical protein